MTGSKIITADIPDKNFKRGQTPSDKQKSTIFNALRHKMNVLPHQWQAALMTSAQRGTVKVF